MGKDYSQKLYKLKTRRLGLDSGAQPAMDSNYTLANALQGLLKSERYETRASKEATKYALGAMQEVDPEYTQVGIQEADRVAVQLSTGLNVPVTFELQGSLPLNLHIRGVSDVDLLVLHGNFFTGDSSGPLWKGYITVAGNTLDDMRKLRTDCEGVLNVRFWGATVDTSGTKSIKLSGGSLKRKVDVVPSHWHNTVNYQYTARKEDRGVKIWDKEQGQTLLNMPFLHMHKINEKDFATDGGLKKSIRLLKNLHNDALEDGKDIPLTSYDLASIMWHCDNLLLKKATYQELSIVAAVQVYINHLSNNYSYASNLMTPDGSRKIFDEAAKFTGLVRLNTEVLELAANIVNEVNAAANLNIPQTSLQKVLDEAVVY